MTKKGNKIFLDVRDNVPYLKSWHENISVPARPAPQESAAGKPAQSDSEALASQLAKDHDFSVAACRKLLASVKFKKDTIQRSVVQGKKGKSEYIILGVYAHGGIQGITRKSDDHPKLTEYLCRFLKHHGASDHFPPFASITGPLSKFTRTSITRPIPPMSLCLWGTFKVGGDGFMIRI